jgi:imidazolonepropionase-like amidohydrolase
MTVLAGRALAPAGRYGAFLGREVYPGEPLGRLVEEEVRRGARVIKVILSGSVDFERGTAEGPFFDAASLAEIVAAARSLEVPVACHANGYPSVRLAAAAGVNSIEHGILSDEEGVRAMAEAGVCWVPTLTPLHNLAAVGQWPALPAILARHQEDVARGVELGVAVLPGTDGGSPGVPHGSLLAELALLAQAGLSGEALVAAAGRRAAQLLALPRGYGCLETGAVTDLVWFRGDPGVDPSQVGPPLGAVVAGRLATEAELAGP